MFNWFKQKEVNQKYKDRLACIREQHKKEMSMLQSLLEKVQAENDELKRRLK